MRSDRLSAAGARSPAQGGPRGRRGDGDVGDPLHRRSLRHLEGRDRGRAGQDVPPDPRTLPGRGRVLAGPTMSRPGGGWSVAGDLARATAGFDAVILPTVPILPPNRAADDRQRFYVTENLLTLRNTRIGNLMGLCGADAADRRALDRSHFLGAPWPRSACCGWARRQRRRWLNATLLPRTGSCGAGRCWTGAGSGPLCSAERGATTPEEAVMVFPERFANLPDYAFPRLRALLTRMRRGASPSP
jgi:hypothetical protein